MGRYTQDMDDRIWKTYQADPSYERTAAKLGIKDPRTVKVHVESRKAQIAAQPKVTAPPPVSKPVIKEEELYPVLFQDLKAGKSEVDLVIERKISPDLARKANEKFQEAMGAFVLPKAEKERMFRALEYYNIRVDLIENGTWTFDEWANSPDMMCQEVEERAENSRRYEDILEKLDFRCEQCGGEIVLDGVNWDHIKSYLTKSGLKWHHEDCNV